MGTHGIIRSFVFRIIAGAMILAGSTVSAAPAVVRTFEVTARQAPRNDARAEHVFPEKAELSVSEEVTDGWRRVRLPDGKSGWVRDDQIRLVALDSRPIQPLVTSPSAEQSASSRQVIYVKDLNHLADLVREDAGVHARASALAQRQFASKALIWGGGVSGLLLAVGGMTVFAGQECFGSDRCMKTTNDGAFYGGLALVGVSSLVGALLLPWRSDVLDVVNEWNGRHVDRPFTLEHEPGIAK